MGLTRRQLIKKAICGLVVAVIPVRLASMVQASEIKEELCWCGRPASEHEKFDMDEWVARAAEEMKVQIDKDVLESITGRV